MNECIFTIEQISKLLNVSEEQVRRWIREGKLSGKLASKKQGYRVNESDLKDFMHKNPKYRVDIQYDYDDKLVIRELESHLIGLYRTISRLQYEYDLIQRTIDRLKEES